VIVSCNASILTIFISVWDFIVIGCAYKAAVMSEDFITRVYIPYPFLSSFARFSIWSLYGFVVGLFGMGLWVIAHECKYLFHIIIDTVRTHACEAGGHQAFSESKTVNNTVGWVLHSGCVISQLSCQIQMRLTRYSLGVPYHSWRLSHAKHHASTCHMTQDQVYVPATRLDYNLRALDPAEDDFQGANVSIKVRQELWEALGDSPVSASLECAIYLVRPLDRVGSP